MSAWEADSACAQVDPELFFPERGDSVTAKQAKQICATCRVLEQCRTRALADESLFGIWGGLTRKDRMEARTKARKPGVTAMAESSRRRAHQRAQQIMTLRNAGQDPTYIATKLGICVETVYRAQSRLQSTEPASTRSAA